MDSEVFLWSLLDIAGTPLSMFCRNCPKQCGPPEREAVERTVKESTYHIIENKGFTNDAIGLAATRLMRSVLRHERSVLPVSVLLEGEYGLNDVCLSVPCMMDSTGVARIIETRLNDKEKEQLAASAEIIKESLRSIEEIE